MIAFTVLFVIFNACGWVIFVLRIGLSCGLPPERYSSFILSLFLGFREPVQHLHVMNESGGYRQEQPSIGIQQVMDMKNQLSILFSQIRLCA